MFEKLKTAVIEYTLVYNTEEYFLSYKDKTIQINEDYYHILKCVQDSDSEQTCLQKMQSRYQDVDVDALYNLTDKMLQKIHLTLLQKQSLYTYFNIRLLKLESISGVIKAINFLFKPAVFFSWFVLMVIVSLVSMYTYYYIPNVQLVDTSYYILAFISIVIIHELGHVIAASRVSDKISNIYFGMYVFMPVFYTDVNHVWTGRKIERIIVTMAGHGLQLVPTAICLLLASVYHNEFLYNVGVLSFITCVYGFIFPFGRTDGYWLLVDITGRKGLLKDFYSHLYRWDIKSMDKTTLIYGTFNFIVLGAFLLRGIYFSITNDFTLFKNISNLTLAYNDIILILICVFLLHIIYQILILILRLMRRKNVV